MVVERNSDVDVVVVGAGAAGLAAALRLRRFGFETVVLEASRRIGGRAWTDDSTGLSFDLGAHWLHSGDRNPLSALARENGFVYRKGRRTPCTRLADRWASAKEELERARFFREAMDVVARCGEEGADVAVAEVLPSHPRWSKLLASWVADVSGVEAEQASTVDFAGYQDTRQDWPVHPGLGALVARIGRDAPVRLGVTVRAVDWGGAGVVLRTCSGTLRARAVVLTVSTAVLGSGSVCFEPRLPTWKRDAIEGLPLGLLNKVVLRFDRDRFGMRPGRLAVYEPFAPHTMAFLFVPFGLPLVVGHAGGRFADDLERDGAEAMKDQALFFLREMFGSAVSGGLIAAHTTTWRTDPLFGGAYSAARPGCGNQRAALARPLDDKVFFAGEACSTRHFSTVHGAYLSGLAVAEALARRL